VPWTSGGSTIRARIWDLSVGGCFIDAFNPERAGRRLQIAMPLREELAAPGEVVYALPEQRFAVRFVYVAEKPARVLREAVDCLVNAGQGV
jgi:hypothetical protein